MIPWDDVCDPHISAEHELKELEIMIQVHCMVNLHVTDWKRAQEEDPALTAIIDWLRHPKGSSMALWEALDGKLKPTAAHVWCHVQKDLELHKGKI